MTYTSEISFTTLAAAKGHIDAMGYSAMPVRNRYVSHHFGDLGERRVSFAHIITREDEYVVYEVDREV